MAAGIEVAPGFSLELGRIKDNLARAGESPDDGGDQSALSPSDVSDGVCLREIIVRDHGCGAIINPPAHQTSVAQDN